MPNESYEEAVRLIQAHSEEADFEGPQTNELIVKAEKFLALTFPEPYRSFLKEFGCGDFDGEEIFGLMDEEFENSAVPDAVWFSAEMRRLHGLPDSLVGIGQLNDGEIIVLETGPGVQSGAVYLVQVRDVKDKASWELLAEDFGEYLLSRINAALGE